MFTASSTNSSFAHSSFAHSSFAHSSFAHSSFAHSSSAHSVSWLQEEFLHEAGLFRCAVLDPYCTSRAVQSYQTSLSAAVHLQCASGRSLAAPLSSPPLSSAAGHSESNGFREGTGYFRCASTVGDDTLAGFHCGPCEDLGGDEVREVHGGRVGDGGGGGG